MPEMPQQYRIVADTSANLFSVRMLPGQRIALQEHPQPSDLHLDELVSALFTSVDMVSMIAANGESSLKLLLEKPQAMETFARNRDLMKAQGTELVRRFQTPANRGDDD